jgi:hypothetical protein
VAVVVVVVDGRERHDGCGGWWWSGAPGIRLLNPIPSIRFALLFNKQNPFNHPPRGEQRVDKLKARSPQEALQFTAQELMGMLKEATGSLKRFAAPGGMEGLTGPLGIVQVGGWVGGWVVAFALLLAGGLVGGGMWGT